MATTAKLKPDGLYEVFRDGQRIATGTASSLSQYGLSPTSLTDEAITSSGQKVNPATGQIITGDMLKDTASVNFASPEVAPPSDISGLPEIKLTPQEEKQTSLEKMMQDLNLSISGKAAFETEKRGEFGVAAAQQAYDDLNTQLRDLQRQQQLVPLAVQRESEGRGRTEAGVEPLEIGKRRALAYDALTTSSLIDAAQGRLASAERKVIEAVNQKFAPLEAEYAAILKNLNIIKNSPETTVQEMNRANKQEAIIKARQEANTKAKEEAKNILNWATKAAENMAKQGTLSSENNLILNRIKNAKTENEAFTLATPFLAEKDKLTGQSDFEQAFLRDKGRLPTVAELQQYKKSQEKPIIKDYEVGGRLIREILDPYDPSKVLSRTDLGVKEKKGVDLSGLDINSPTYIQDVMKASAGGKKPNQVETIRPLQKATTVMSQLSELSLLISKTTTDPIVGLVRSMNPYDFDARAIQATLQATVPNLARGVYGEVGVLTDNDIKNYIKTLPNIKSTEEQNKFVMGMTLRSLQRGFESQLEVLASAGYDVSGFQNVYQRMNNTAQAIESEMNIVGIPEEDEIKEEFEILKRGGSPETVNYYKPMSDFFRELKNSLFK